MSGDHNQYQKPDKCERCGEVNPAEIHTCTPQAPVAWMYNGNLHEFDPSDWAEGEVIPLYTAPPRREATQEPVACIVKNCQNHRCEGKFVGDLCSPCHTFIMTGEGIYSQAYRNTQREWQTLTDEEKEYFRRLGLVGVEIIEAKLKEKNT